MQSVALGLAAKTVMSKLCTKIENLDSNQENIGSQYEMTHSLL